MNAAAAMAEQLAVGEVAPGRRAVVGQEHRRAAMRADVNRARDQLLAGAALAGDQHGQVVALQPLDLLDDAGHRGAGAEKPGQQRLERRDRRPGPAGAGGRSRAAHSAKPCRATAAIIRSRRITGWPIGRGEATSAEARAVGDRGRAARRRSRRGRTASPCAADARQRARRVGVAAGDGDHAHVAAGELDEDDGAVGRRRLRAAPRRSRAPSSSGSAAASTIRRTIASSASAGEMTYSPVPIVGQQRLRGVGVVEIALGAELLEDRAAPCSDGARRPSARRFRRRAGRARDG